MTEPFRIKLVFNGSKTSKISDIKFNPILLSLERGGVEGYDHWSAVVLVELYHSTSTTHRLGI